MSCLMNINCAAIPAKFKKYESGYVWEIKISDSYLMPCKQKLKKDNILQPLSHYFEKQCYVLGEEIDCKIIRH